LIISIAISLKEITKMKIASLRIMNFRGIRDVNLSDLGEMVIIAGQSGSGKSCLY